MQLEIVSFDGDATINDGVNYRSGPPRGTLFRLVKAKGVGGERIGDFPLWALKGLRGGTLTILIILLAPGAATLSSQRDALAQLFDVYDTGGPKRLIVRDIADGNRQWYIDCDPVDFKPDKGSPSAYVITLFAPDPVWRESVLQSDTWNVVASGATRNITARGNRPTPLELRITPTANKGNDFGFEHLVDVRNPNQWELNQYPVDLTNGGWDTATIITATEMQGNGNDLRVYVDGKRVARWLADINTDHTKVWINLDMRPGAQVTSLGAFNIGTLTLTYARGSRVGRFKRRNGCFRIQNEMVAYAAWNRETRQFTGCTRGVRGTTEANHVTGQTVYWVEHHIKIVYGDSTLGAPAQSNDRQPIFELDDSSNTQWWYESFGDGIRKRSGRWMHRTGGELQENQTVDCYTGNRGIDADPWTEMGLEVIKRNPQRPGDYWDTWYFRAQVDITNTRFEGEYIVDNAADIVRYVLRDKVPEKNWRRVWQQNFTTNVAWTAWGPITQAPRSGTRHLRLEMRRVTEGDAAGSCYAEVEEARLTFDANQIPDVDGPTTWTRIANPYHGLPRITNNTTGEYIELDFIQILNHLVTVDSEDHTIVYRGQNQYQALVEASSWEEWLMAEPGVNQLQIDEAGLAGVTIVTRWRGRNS